MQSSNNATTDRSARKCSQPNEKIFVQTALIRRTSSTQVGLIVVAIVAMLAVEELLGVSRAADSNGISSPAELWQGYDPETEPLEEEIIAKWVDEHGQFQKLYFTGETVDGIKVRVFAIVGLPAAVCKASSVSLPGILHIHGGGQTASLDWVKFWTKRGYACVSFDFCGPWEKRTEFTKWGPLKHCNMADAGGGLQVTPTPRASSWYHWTVVSRRALTLLARQQGVNPQRLGVFGVSVGGTLCWMVAGSDDRVHAAAPIYGCGYNYDNSKTVWGFPELSSDLALWQRTVSAEAHAPYIRCPLMLLNGTNDFHGWLDDCGKILRATRSKTYVAYAANCNHHIPAREGANLPTWMDYQLRGGEAFPHPPRLTIALTEDGVPLGNVIVDERQTVNGVKVYYSLGSRAPPQRFWRHVEAVQSEGKWSATLPVMDTWRPAIAFASVEYSRPLCLASNVKSFVPGQLGIARATLTWSPRLTVAAGWRHLNAHTDPNVERTYLLPPADQSDPSELRINCSLFDNRVPLRAASNFVADPQFCGRANSKLAFDYQGNFDSGISLSLVSRNWTPSSMTYIAKLPPKRFEAELGTIKLGLEDFTNSNQESAASWDSIDTLQVDGEATTSPSPLLRNFRWE